MAIVVLGCRVRLDPGGRLSADALRARVEAAALEYSRRSSDRGAQVIVIASGGRRWGALVEADAMALELACRGVPARAIVRERSSLSTRDNARFTAASLARRGIRSAVVVTSDWHLSRALVLFRRTGLRAVGVPAASDPNARWTTRLWRRGREQLLALADRVQRRSAA